MYGDKFDQLFEAGRAAVLAGRHGRNTPPADGDERWGLSVVLRPDDDAVRRLGEVTRQALAVAGEGHWPTGNEAALHITVRSLEPHRISVPDDDPAAARYREAVDRAARMGRPDLRPVPDADRARHRSEFSGGGFGPVDSGAGPARFEITGLTLTPGGVMACLRPLDGVADMFAARLAEELGPDGAYEADTERDIWYSTLVHFAAPLADPQALVDFVAARRRSHLGTVETGAVEVVHWRYDGRQTVRGVIHRSTMDHPAGSLGAPESGHV
ncbi:hypothetical protein JIG36_42045 [Actinoplanes sp. LDG1-06]|uniref:Uncharacterized protein n=1 Tax=Paractinoplanes ovalisporus TaxID=2810368 RepID=A0ABS2AQJ2_9ACTN|nr:hypothetical protein [Actinoplanes ovalisporus]MBM2622106.1 hypothetical protein [Actinoplanes ovalisporus]